MVDTELMEHRSPQIVDRTNIFNGVISEIVGRTMNRSSFHTTTREPDTKSIWIVIATIATL